MRKIKHIEINIGKACNNKCRFCMSALIGEDEKQLTNIDLVKNEIIEYANKGYNSIGFLGGDISIHKNIYEIINEAKINSYESINVITNAMIFSIPEKAEKLVLSGITRVNISIHSHESKIEDFLTQIPGGFEKKIKAIDNFKKLYDQKLLKDDVSINIVLNGLNYKNIVKTCLFFSEIKKINDIRINFLRNKFFYDDSDKNKLEIKYKDFLPYLRKLIILSLKRNIRITFDSIPACIFYKLGLPNTEFIIEKFLGEDKDKINKISNLNKKMTFNSKKLKKDRLKTKFESCEKCSYYKKCQGVWKEYVESFGSSEFFI